MMKLYCCKIVEDGWGTEYTREKDFVFAQDTDEARAIICKKWQIRKNKKGLRIEEVEPHSATIEKKVTTDLISESCWNTWMQQSYEEKSYKRVTHYFCSKCKGEIESNTQVCTHCGALINS